jgi:hypothetical protein
VHEAVARHLRDHRSGRDCGAARIAVDHRTMLDRAFGHAKAVGEADGSRDRDALQASRQGREVGDVQAAGVDPAHATHRHRHARGRPDHDRVHRLALLGCSLLGIVEVAERAAVAHRQALVVDQHPGGDERPRERATTGLVGTGDEANSELAVELEQLRGTAPAAGDGLGSVSLRLGLRGCRCASAASR